MHDPLHLHSLLQLLQEHSGLGDIAHGTDKLVISCCHKVVVQVPTDRRVLRSGLGVSPKLGPCDVLQPSEPSSLCVLILGSVSSVLISEDFIE